MNLVFNALLISTIILANVPFLSARRFFGWPLGRTKPALLTLLEWCACLLLAALMARLLEAQVTPHQVQHWQFVASNGILFLLMGYVGFAYRYLWTAQKPHLLAKTPAKPLK